MSKLIEKAFKRGKQNTSGLGYEEVKINFFATKIIILKRKMIQKQKK